ncbi:hypothetical protein CFC21_102953 [Triticum aestivum]|uniref:Aminotransferase-like plant mobile domain-containing protein n=2 Tax=Triticum aestivum TaxID=4565 RepID=A0A9R1M6N0_WHEAT|nr:uncharacterized protein LOC123161832 [Triticum aestivum]XP_044435590.1 uncharacterized protein LOC123161832 [Triticum aestivum]KAF7101704.1 hypothetical protein CFC21_102953 [Triticum aestivum]
MDPWMQEYLDRIDAMLDAYTDATRSLAEKVDALVVAWRPDLEKRSSHTAVVHDPPSPIPSLEITTEASAPIPGVSCSTTKAHKVPEVIHKAAPDCIMAAPVTCSTDCLNQVVAHASVNEVRDVATTIFPVDAVDLQEASDTTIHIAKGVGPIPDDATPELTSLEVRGAGLGHEVVAIDVHVPTASAFTGSPVWPSFNSGTSESSLPSTHKDVQEVWKPMPGLFDKPEAVVANVKEHKDDAKLLVITLFMNPSTWYEHFNTRDPCLVSLDAQLVFAEHMSPELRLTWPTLVGTNFSEFCSAGLSNSYCTLSLFPWNPGGYFLMHKNRVTMMLITTSSSSHWHVTRVFEESGQCFSQIAKIQWLFPICMKAMTQCLVILPLVKLDYELWHPPDQQPRMKRKFPWTFRTHPFLNTQARDKELTSYLSMNLFHLGDLVYNTWGRWLSVLGHCIRILLGRLLCLWYLQQDDADSCFITHVKLFHYSEWWFSELCLVTSILTLELYHSCPAATTVHPFRSMTKWGAWNTARSFCLRLIQLEPVLPSNLASRTEQRQLISDTYPWQHVVFGLLYELAYCNEANHYYWYLKILTMLVVQTVQVATEIRDSELSLFVAGAFLLGHKQKFLWTPYTAKFLVFHRTNSAPSYFSVSDRRSCYIVLLDVFRILCYEPMLATGIQPRLSECQPGDWFHDVFLSVCNTYTPEPTLAKFQALKKCDCEHLISTGACNLFMDKGCLKRHMVHEENDSIVVQTSRIQCVQPRCYLEVGSTQAYLKLKEVDVAVTYMFELRNNSDWELLTHFNRPPDPASIWECITGRSFPRDQILLMIFHPWPPTHVTYLIKFCCCGSRAVTRQMVFQGGQGVVAITVGFPQGSVDHKYYHGFDSDYFGFSCDWIAIGHGYYNPVIQVNPDCGYHNDFELVKEHRVQWDPGGSRWLRLGVKPDLKNGGMLAALLTCMHMGLATGPLMDLARPLPHRCSYKYQIKRKEEGIQWITDEPGGGYLPLFSYLCSPVHL